MQTKDITDALGITRERIKYYKKEGVFVPENPIVNGKTKYTFRDFENLKRLVILTKSGLQADRRLRINRLCKPATPSGTEE